MTNEEIQRRMEFILEHQAQFAVSMQRLDEERAREKEERVRDGSRIPRLEEPFQLLVQLAQATDARMDNLESRGVDINHSQMTNLDAKMAALAEAQTHADERLSALIDIV